MKNIKLFLLLLLPFFLFSQEKEKRLALVIGNANYDKGELKNPVNDARLIASTLDSLDFDVILKENLSTKRDMTAAIREFGSRRSEYDVAFVYYAGHGVQVDDENFLLPTKETFNEEFDVMDYGVSVQRIMRYLRAQTNQVNILILDACRDNPFESSWGNTRSLKGQGLAKIPPPTGSLIAFSTDSGQTAPDGDGENSVYSISLAKNMLLEETSIDQVFRNVRAEVLRKTGGAQRPVEATQLTGNTFYFIPLSLDKLVDSFDDALVKGDNELALNLSFQMVNNYPNESISYAKSGHIRMINDDYSRARHFYQKALDINPYSYEALSCELFTLDNQNITLGLIETLIKTVLNNGGSQQQKYEGSVAEDVSNQLVKLIQNNIMLHQEGLRNYFLTKATGGISSGDLNYFLFRLDIALKAYDFSKNDQLLDSFFYSNTIFNQLKPIPASLQAILCSQISSIYSSISILKKSKDIDPTEELKLQSEFADKAINYETEANTPGNGICYLYGLKAKGLMNQGKYEEARQLLLKSLEHPKNNNETKITSFGRLSNIYFYLENKTQAYSYAEKALELTLKNNPTDREVFDQLTRSALVCYVYGDYLKAFSFLERGYDFDQIITSDIFNLFLRTLVLQKLDGEAIICENGFFSQINKLKWRDNLYFKRFGDLMGGYVFWQAELDRIEKLEFSCN